ncbi:MAG: methylated-DNA--[protein]-cysteine S-methyltransferase [Alphaproteobacteria bacterium]|nr:methylated-DNA--[protein]-cysteine S-methyltransferase [Alphaproteobacteria bacterium]
MHFFSVRTTGVYCRPSCGARPKPENVAFHATREEAERAGFRPCKRCRPERELLSVAVATTSLGLTLVAHSGKGVCAMLFGTSRASLMRDLTERFPGAVFAKEERALEPFVSGADFALDLRGTPFQARVWQALRQIPSGRTASYADIARAIGRPKAVRAVAQACAANPVAVIVPCHRVVRSDGALSGYRWGADRKRALLAREAA